MKINNLISTFKIYNGELEEILEKENNIFLGVSISLKPFSQKLAKQYLEFIINHSKEHAGILIADDIAKINYHYIDKKSKAKSLEFAREKGDERIESYQRLIDKLEPQKQDKIQIYRWADVWNLEMKEKVDILRDEFNRNSDFKNQIKKPIVTYLKKRGRSINSKRLENLSEYILSELPSLLNGIVVNGISYKTMLYPTFSNTSMYEFVKEIQNSSKYEKLRDKLKIPCDNILIDSIIKE